MTPADEVRAVEAAADMALATGLPVAVPALGVMLVPDVVMLEGIANGHEVTPTARMRKDGRTVHVYQLPAGLLAVVPS